MSEVTAPKILESLQKVNDELRAIGKDKQGYGYKFRGIDDVLCAIGPLFKKYKIITKREVVDYSKESRTTGKGKEVSEVRLRCKYHFVSLEDGSQVDSEGIGEGQDSSGSDKATGMAISNTYKYVIFEMFNIATEEQKDSDQVTAEENLKGERKEEAKVRGSSFRKKADIPRVQESNTNDEI